MPLDTSLILRAGQSNSVGVPELLKNYAKTVDMMHELPIAQQKRELGLQEQQNKMQQQAQEQEQEAQQQAQEQQMRKAGILNNTAKALRGLPEAQRRTYIASLDQSVLDDFGIDSSKIASLQLDNVSLDNAISETSLIINKPAQEQSATASERERDMLYAELEGAIDENGNLKPLNQLTAKHKAAARALQMIAKPVGSSAQTITQEGTAQSVADTEQIIAGAKQTGKNRSDLELKPQITSAVKDAELAAKTRGESLNEYERAKAAYPGLQEVTANLRQLSEIATYSLGGKAFDLGAKQLGFGATKGATARAKFIAVIDNQVLPLLKDTFGAAFTEREGEALKRTMGDPDATPEEKQEQLDAFIENIERELERKRTLAEGGSASATQTGGAGEIKVLGFR